ncbi:MAG: hypothetical protein WKF83_16215 [Nocardioidaceae bacterium]
MPPVPGGGPAIVSTVSLLAASAVAVATGSIDRLTLVLTLVVVLGTFMMVLAAGGDGPRGVDTAR